MGPQFILVDFSVVANDIIIIYKNQTYLKVFALSLGRVSFRNTPTGKEVSSLIFSLIEKKKSLLFVAV